MMQRGLSMHASTHLGMDRFNISGIPALVIVDALTGNVVNADARPSVHLDPLGMCPAQEVVVLGLRHGGDAGRVLGVYRPAVPLVAQVVAVGGRGSRSPA